MNCTDFHRVVREYHEGHLPPRQQRGCEQHEQNCPPCGEFMRTSRESCCKDLIEFLSAYVEKELPERQHEVFERHLGVCFECVDYVASFTATIELTQSLCDVDCESIPQALVDAILAARRADEDLG